MHTKTLIKLIIILGVLSLLSFFVLFKNKSSSSESTRSAKSSKLVLEDLDLNEINKIQILQGDNQANLELVDNLWTIKEKDNYPVNFTNLRDLVIKLGKLEKIQTLGVPDSELGRFNLASDSAVKPMRVILLDKNGDELANLLMSASSQNDAGQVGRFVTLKDTSEIHLISDVFPTLDTKDTYWISKDFYEIEKVKDIAYQSPNPSDSWKITRPNEDAEFTLTDGKPEQDADQAKTSPLKWIFGRLQFLDVLNLEEAKDIKFGLNAHGATITTFDDRKYELQLIESPNKKEATNPDQSKEYLLKITADVPTVPTSRSAKENETEEEKAKLDKEWEAAQESLKKKLAIEDRLSKRVFVLDSFLAEKLLIPRGAMVTLKKKESETTKESK